MTTPIIEAYIRVKMIVNHLTGFVPPTLNYYPLKRALWLGFQPTVNRTKKTFICDR